MDSALVEDDWRISFEGTLGKHRLKFTFGKEVPMANNWKVWRGALDNITIGNLHLELPLGKWMATTHRIWRCFHHPTNSSTSIEVHSGDRVDV